MLSEDLINLVFARVVYMLGHGCFILVSWGFSIENGDNDGEDVDISKGFGNINDSLCYLFRA